MMKPAFCALFVAVVVLLIVLIATLSLREHFDARMDQDVRAHADVQLRTLMAVRARPEFNEYVGSVAAGSTASEAGRSASEAELQLALGIGVARPEVVALDELILRNDAIRLELADNPDCDYAALEAELQKIDAIVASRKSERETIFVY